jgi:hypothetical protein
VVGYFIYNYGLTGDPMSSAYNDPATQLGFKGGNTLAVGLRNEQAQVAALLLVLNNWPLGVAFMFIFVPFILGTRDRWDWFCATCALATMAAYVLYRYSGVYEGPRYWYEIVPFLLLLTSRGIDLAADLSRRVASELRADLGRRGTSSALPGYATVYSIVALLVILGSGGWLFGLRASWNEGSVPLVPEEPRAMRGVFGVDNRLLRIADGTELHDALVLVRPCGFFQVPTCFGSVFNENALDFKGDVVWARYIPGRAKEIIDAYPGRSVYIATWDNAPSIEPYDPRKDP